MPVGSWRVDVYSAVAENLLAYEDMFVSTLMGRLMNRRFRVVLALLSTAVYVSGCGNQPAGYSSRSTASCYTRVSQRPVPFWCFTLRVSRSLLMLSCHRQQ